RTVTLPNGIRVVMVPEEGAPLFSVGLVLPYHSELDGAGEPGAPLLEALFNFGQGASHEGTPYSFEFKSAHLLNTSSARLSRSIVIRVRGPATEVAAGIEWLAGQVLGARL